MKLLKNKYLLISIFFLSIFIIPNFTYANFTQWYCVNSNPDSNNIYQNQNCLQYTPTQIEYILTPDRQNLSFIFYGTGYEPTTLYIYDINQNWTGFSQNMDEVSYNYTFNQTQYELEDGTYYMRFQGSSGSDADANPKTLYVINGLYYFEIPSIATNGISTINGFSYGEVIIIFLFLFLCITAFGHFLWSLIKDKILTK